MANSCVKSNAYSGQAGYQVRYAEYLFPLTVNQAVGIPLHGQRSEYLRFAIEAYFAGDRVALVQTMAERIQNLQAGDLGALVNYYSSYRSAD